MASRMNELHLDLTDIDLAGLKAWGRDLAEWQRNLNWYIGDLAIAARDMLGDDYAQVFPSGMSLEVIKRCEAVSRAYPIEYRNPSLSWSTHELHSGKPNRLELIASPLPPVDEPKQTIQDDRVRWLLAIDVNYHVTRMWASGAETEAAKEVSAWIKRTVGRLKEKGLTDVVCCLDSPSSFRKELTKEWEDKYKDRATKDPELIQQLRLVEDMVSEFCCAKADGFEADDFMASFAKQFDGKVTMFTVDKDMRQCLSSKCNMLVDVQWSEDPTSGQMLPEYKWVSVKDHLNGCTYNGTAVSGISPEQWTSFQCLAGDSSDNISGAEGIGATIAANLIKEFGTIEAIIQAAKDGDDRITRKKREALIAFEPKYEITRQLVTLRTDLPIPTTTRIL